uniref:Uncharacterized protein n=1 Tax=Glossina austeni TaxID=7395 RepID=A0A1A9VQN4_GLOAU
MSCANSTRLLTSRVPLLMKTSLSKSWTKIPMILIVGEPNSSKNLQKFTESCPFSGPPCSALNNASEIEMLVATGMSLLFISWNQAESIAGDSSDSSKNLRMWKIKTKLTERTPIDARFQDYHVLL